MIRITNNFRASSAERKIRAAIGLYADTVAKRLEAEAKENAPWTDRTTNARNSIQGDSEWDGDKLKIILSGNVDYFVYLELANEKKYATLKPTIDKNAPEVLKGFQRLVK